MSDEETILKHLEKLVNIMPITDDQAAVEHALFYCDSVLRTTGSFKDVAIHENNKVYSLTASTQATKWPEVLLQAHIDVVPSPDTLKFLVDDESVYGRGVFDMLFAAACYLTFVEKHSEALATLDIGIMLSGDEENGGGDSVAYLLDQGYGANVCLLPDSGDGMGDLTISAKGVYNFNLVMGGASHHGSRPWEGDGAGNKLINMLHELFQIFDSSDQANSTLTVAKLSGGDATNRAPSTAMAHLDIRYKDKADLERIQAVLNKLCQQFGAHIEPFYEGFEFDIDPSNHYIQNFIDIYKRHVGKEIVLSRAPGSCDARYFIDKGIPVILCRPEGIGAHSDHESISRQELISFYKLFEDFTLQTARMKAIHAQ